MLVCLKLATKLLTSFFYVKEKEETVAFYFLASFLQVITNMEIIFM